jgi:hypothetical protein
MDGKSPGHNRVLADAAKAAFAWQRAQHGRIAQYRSVLHDPAAYRARIIEEIMRSRRANKLATRSAEEIAASLDARGDGDR